MVVFLSSCAGVTNDVDMERLKENLSKAANTGIRVCYIDINHGKNAKNPLDNMR